MSRTTLSAFFVEVRDCDKEAFEKFLKRCAYVKVSSKKKWMKDFKKKICFLSCSMNEFYVFPGVLQQTRRILVPSKVDRRYAEGSE